MSLLLLIIASIGVCYSQPVNNNLSKANSLLFQKDYLNALSEYNQLMMEVTDSADLSYIYSYAAICHENLGDSANAYLNYKNAVNYKTREHSIYNKLYSMAKKKNDLECQKFVLIQKLELFPSDKNSTLNKLANLYASSQQYNELFDLTGRLIHDDPDNYKYYYLQAISFQGIGKSNEAELSYRKSLGLNPVDFGANMGLGFLIFNQASAAFEKEQVRYDAIKDPSWKNYLAYLGNIKKIKNLYLEAEPFLEKACQQKCNSQLEKALEILKSRTSQISRDEKSSENKMKMD